MPCLVHLLASVIIIACFLPILSFILSAFVCNPEPVLAFPVLAHRHLEARISMKSREIVSCNTPDFACEPLHALLLHLLPPSSCSQQ